MNIQLLLKFAKKNRQNSIEYELSQRSIVNIETGPFKDLNGI